MTIKSIVGENIRGFRKEIGWTQEKLAVRAKLNSEYISRLERGLENATLETLHKIAKTLQIDVWLLLKRDSYK